MSEVDFHNFMESLPPEYTIKSMYYKEELVGVADCRKSNSFTEIHSAWFTESKRKRVLVMKEFLSRSKEKLVTFAPDSESSGYFSLVRRGVLEFIGKHEGMNMFQTAGTKQW